MNDTKTITLTGEDALKHVVDTVADVLAAADGADDGAKARAAEDALALIDALSDGGTLSYQQSFDAATGTLRVRYLPAGAHMEGTPATISASWRGASVSLAFESASGIVLDLLGELRARLDGSDAQECDETLAWVLISLHDLYATEAAQDCA